MELSDIKVNITLEQYFNFLMYRHNDDTAPIVVSDEWIQENNLKSIEGIEKLVHFNEIVNAGPSAKATFVEIHKLENWKNKQTKELVARNKDNNPVVEAMNKHKIIEEWKVKAIQTLMLKCAAKMTTERANAIIIRIMSGENSDFARNMAKALDYPYRKENEVIEETEVTIHKEFDPRHI